jgi:hypothetical protein
VSLLLRCLLIVEVDVRLPYSIFTVADILEEGGITYAEYEENMPSDGFTGMKCVAHPPTP